MPYSYRWARGEAKARELAAKVSKCNAWNRCETIAKCGSVTCHMHEFKLEGDKHYKDYWLCFQHTGRYPDDSSQWDKTPGFCTDRDFPQLPKQRLQDGLENIYR